MPHSRNAGEKVWTRRVNLQGANQSIEDAIVLADCLVEARAQKDDWENARRSYQKQRLERTRLVHVASITTADVLHLPDGPMAEARNARLGAPDAWTRPLAWIHEFVADHATTPDAARVCSRQPA